MKAPEKIYIDSTNDGLLDFWYEAPTDNKKVKSVEYIRADLVEPVTECHELEEEINEEWKPLDQMGFDLTKSQFASIARHFAEWGAEHLKR